MGAIRRSDQFVGTGVALFAARRSRGSRGSSRKRLDAPYVRGRSAAWVKIKAFRHDGVLSSAADEGEGAASKALGALLLGIYRAASSSPSVMSARASTSRTLKELLATLQRARVADHAFATERA